MPTIKYIFLSLLWSLLPSVSAFSTNTTIQFPFQINAINEQHSFEMRLQVYTKSGFFSMPTIPTVPPFSWKDPNRLSFIEMQQAAMRQQAAQSTSPLQAIIEYQAKDSIVFDTRQKYFNIYGAGTIGYGDTQLTAENISLDWATNTIIATGKKNELDKIDPKPVFQQGSTKYIAEEIRYNFESKRGTARKLFTNQDQALIRCHKAKMDTEDTYYVDRMKFTTCNLPQPHYFIKARNVKFVKDKQITSGPFQFYFDGVPTILGFFYGLFFIPASKASGILFPQVGEDGKKGFFLKQGGYYFYFNDYVDLALKGTIYSQGHSAFIGDLNYKKRYAYTGQFFYNREITSHTSEMALQEDKEREWRVKWLHNTENNRVYSLAADVDIQSRSPRHSLQKNEEPDKLHAKTQSKVRYTRKLLGTPYTLTTSIAHSKDFLTNLTNITFPQVVLATAPIYPFRWGSAVPKHWYEDINFKHTSEFQNELTNVINKDTLEFSSQNWPKLLKESRYGAKHTLPLETNIKLFTYFNLRPSVQYIERWYFKKLDYRYNPAQNTILADTLKSFNRVWDYNMGAELRTTLYGTHFFSDEAMLEAVRHRIEPSAEFVYTPDFSKEKFGYWQKIQTKHGEKVLDRFSNAVYGTPRNKASALLNVKLDNMLEIKTKNREKLGGKPKKNPIFESLYINTSYDFLADSFPLGDINLGARTRLLDSLINVEYNTTFDPYIYSGKRRVEEFAWQHGRGLGLMKKYAFKIGTTLKSKNNSSESLHDVGKSSTRKRVVEESKTQQASRPVILNTTQYVDFDIPWQLALSYQQNYTYQIEIDKKETIRQLVFNGDVNITKNWKIMFNSVYDFDKKELVGSATKIGIYRDLHCWQMSFDWVPLANKQSYEFSIGLKAAMLQDLKFPHNREYDKV